MKYFLDTNIFIRIYLGDNDIQLKFVEEFINKARKNNDVILVALDTIIEFEYVLRKVYKQDKIIVIKYIKSILTTSYLKIPEKQVAELAMNLFEICNADFVDCVLFSRSTLVGGKVVSFDKDFKKIKMAYEKLDRS